MNYSYGSHKVCSICGTLLAVIDCPECNGFGYKSGWLSNQTCAKCHGAGHIAQCPKKNQHFMGVHIPITPPFPSVFGEPINLGKGIFDSQKQCPKCNGSGIRSSTNWKESLIQEIITGRTCPKCHGKGWIL